MMVPRFKQDLSIYRMGFGNTVKAVIGTPTPDPDSLITGSKLLRFDMHPLVAKDGFPVPGGGDEQPVDSCNGVMIMHYGGLTETVIDMDYDEYPAFWGLPGYLSLDALEYDPHVQPSDDLTEVVFEVGYDSTVFVSWNVDRVCYQYIEVEKDSETVRFENVGCTPIEDWQAEASFRMWGQTDSWGSEGDKILVVPYSYKRMK